jgi:hypothetical protein
MKYLKLFEGIDKDDTKKYVDDIEDMFELYVVDYFDSINVPFSKISPDYHLHGDTSGYPTYFFEFHDGSRHNSYFGYRKNYRYRVSIVINRKKMVNRTDFNNQLRKFKKRLSNLYPKFDITGSPYGFADKYFLTILFNS